MAHSPSPIGPQQPKPAKQMRCKLMIRGGKIHHRRRATTPHLYFNRMVTVEQAGKIIEYLSQFPEP